MEKRIVVLKKGVEKKEIIEGMCCYGGFIPFIW
jgi:hypothetical protein